jgi:hypothetical protein
MSDEDFTVPTDAEAPKRGRKTKTEDSAAPERLCVRFLETSGPGGGDSIVGVHNGMVFSYPRNQEIDVPVAVLKSLEDAYYVEPVSATGAIRRVPKCPYQVVR